MLESAIKPLDTDLLLARIVVRLCAISDALRLADSEDRCQLEEWITKSEGTYDPAEKIAAVTALYDKIGIRRLCDEKIRFYFERANHILKELALSDERKQPLWEMAHALLDRKS